jgi:hypothetical protein
MRFFKEGKVNNEKVTKSWSVAVAIIAAIICIAGAALSITSVAKAQQTQPCNPAVSVQWQPQSVLETMISARIIEDNKAIKNGLQALAKNPDMTPEEMNKHIGNSYFAKPRLWVNGVWVEGLENVLPYLSKIVAGSTSISINTVSALVEYLPYAGAKTPEEDDDARIRVRMTFSASPGDNITEGELCHRRVCTYGDCLPTK